MATGLQYKNDFSTSGGYSNGISSGRIANWTGTSLSGSHTTKVYWDDSGLYVSTQSRVYMTVVDTWTGTRNSDNSITLKIKSTFEMNREVWRQDCRDGCVRNIKVFTDTSRSNKLYEWQEDDRYGASHSGSREWTLTLAHGKSTNVGSFFVVNRVVGYSESGIFTDYISAGLAFKNTLPAAPYAPAADLSCDHVANSSKGTVSLKVTDWGCPGGGDPANNCSLSSTVEWFTDSEYKNRVATGTGEKSLAPNTKYYIRATITNGYKTTTKTCSFTTLATSSVYNYKYFSDQVSRITVQANYGGEACAISTIMQWREKGTSTWHNFTLATPALHGTETETMRNLLERGKTYEARTQTTNCAGTYTSPVYEFAPPAKDSIVGQITTHNDTLGDSGLTTVLDYCYKVTAYTLETVSEDNPITSHFEYRQEGQDVWTTLDSVTSTKSPDTICGQIDGLACGSKYYLRSYQKVGSVESYSPVVEHTTAQCADIHNCVCDNLNYMTELICQTLNRIKEGEKTIYANCPTKELCDPYSENPTITSILSRIVRFSQMVGCLICSMEALDFAQGQDDEVYTATQPGDYGQFIPLSQKATEDSDDLISSVAVKNAINEFLESVLRPIGTYNYYAEDLDDLKAQATGAKKGDTAVIGGNYYTFGGTNWTNKGAVPHLQALGLVNILDGKWGLHEFYWWDDEWNLLDLNTKQIEERVGFLEKHEDDVVYDEDSNHHNMMTAPLTYTDAQISSLAHAKYAGEEVAVFLYEGGSTSTCWILDTDLLDGSVGLC